MSLSRIGLCLAALSCVAAAPKGSPLVSSLMAPTLVPRAATGREPASAHERAQQAAAVAAAWARVARDPIYVDVSDWPGARLDVRYATSANFLNRDVYGGVARCYLHREAAAKLRVAMDKLRVSRPGWKLLLFDCLRPRSVQRQMWDIVRGGPHEAYVADPGPGSIHNFGFAVDLSLVDREGREVDMGTPYDFFGEKAEPRHESRFAAAGELTPAQLDNRRALRSIMTKAGFLQLPNEWWHYDALDGAAVRARYPIVD